MKFPAISYQLPATGYRLLIPICSLLLLFSACGKEGIDTRLRILTEEMTGGAKVWVDPSSTVGASSSATWVTGENIDLNGNAYPIAKDGSDFYLNTNSDAIPSNKYAIYPATLNANGNKVTVTNHNGSGSTVVIESLALNFRTIDAVEGHDILLPMAAKEESGSMRLLFNHLTAALRMTLTNNSGSSKTLGSLKVVTYGASSAAGAIGEVNGVTCRWEHQGLVLPGGEIGGIEGDPSIGYASEMHFTLKNNGEAGKEVANGNSINLCVPVTINKISKIEITGYDNSGAQLFFKTKTIDEFSVTANTMYTIPEIKF